MSDPRETPFNGRIAHVSLEGKVDAERFVDGTAHNVITPVTTLMDADGSSRLRELLLGEGFLVLDTEDGLAFGMAQRDGYVGYVSDADLGPSSATGHIVDVVRSYAKPSPKLKAFEPVEWLSFGSRIVVTAEKDGWARFEIGSRSLWMPSRHLRPSDVACDDPVAVAQLFLGTPYLWGGNSALGLDCSGLIQAAMLACGTSCPGDSDQQQDQLGTKLAETEPPMRGDLYFWEGHVGILSDPETLLHANAHHMAVAEEPLAKAISRIQSKEGLPVLCRRRVT